MRRDGATGAVRTVAATRVSRVQPSPIAQARAARIAPGRLRRRELHHRSGALTLRRLRPLLVGFVPLVGRWLLLSGLVIAVVGAEGVRVDTISPGLLTYGLLNLTAGVVLAAYLVRRGVRWWHVVVLACASATAPVVASLEVSPA